MRMLWKWKILFISVILGATLGLGSPIANAQEKLNEENSFGDEVTAVTAKGEEVRIESQYGEAREIRENNHQVLEKEADDLKTFTTAINHDQKIQVFKLEGETQEQLPPELEGKLVVEYISIPHEVASSFKQLGNYIASRPGAFAKAVKESHVKPNWGAGRTVATIRGITSAIVWFSMPGVSWEMAAFMVATQVSVTLVGNAYNVTLNNLYRYGLKAKETRRGKISNDMVKIGRNAIYDYPLANFINFLSGMRNTPLQLTTTFIPTALIGNLQSAKRTDMLEKFDEKYLANDAAILTAPLFYFWQALDGTGKLKALYHIGTFQVRSSLVGTLTVQTGMILGYIYFPDTMVSIFRKVHTVMEKLYSSIDRGWEYVSSGFCNEILKGPSKETLDGPINENF